MTGVGETTSRIPEPNDFDAAQRLLDVLWPDPHRGSRCPASDDGSVGFYSATDLGDGTSEVSCPNRCGWWRQFDPLTGQLLDGSD